MPLRIPEREKPTRCKVPLTQDTVPISLLEAAIAHQQTVKIPAADT